MRERIIEITKECGYKRFPDDKLGILEKYSEPEYINAIINNVNELQNLKFHRTEDELIAAAIYYEKSSMKAVRNLKSAVCPSYLTEDDVDEKLLSYLSAEDKAFIRAISNNYYEHLRQQKRTKP